MYALFLVDTSPDMCEVKVNTYEVSEHREVTDKKAQRVLDHIVRESTSARSLEMLNQTSA